MKTKTMYLHTFDGEPAHVMWYLRGPFLFRTAPRQAARLETSLKNIRRSQAACQRHAATVGGHEEFAEIKRYGYVRVEVPV